MSQSVLSVNGQIISTTFAAALANYRDAFGRLRTSEPTTLFSDHFQNYDMSSLRWSKAGAGTVTLNKNDSSIDLVATVGQRVVNQTKSYIPYQPGKSSLTFMTGVLTTDTTTGATVRFGLFDSQVDKTVTGTDARDRGGDGHGFMISNGVLGVFQRRTITSSPYQSDIIVNQSSWNLDKLDGTGISKLVFDPTKANIFVIQREWLGVGSVYMGIVYDLNILWCHKFMNENQNTTTYMKRASLPVRYEIDNTSGTKTTTAKQVCCSVCSEGGFNPRGRVFSVDNFTNPRTVGTTIIPLVSIRLASTNIRGIINPLSASALNDGSDIMRVVIIYNPTLTGASWTSVSPFSFAEYDISATAITGGTVIFSTLLNSTNNSKDDILVKVENVIYLGSDISGNSDVMTVAAIYHNGSATNTMATFQFQEIE